MRVSMRKTMPNRIDGGKKHLKEFKAFDIFSRILFNPNDTLCYSQLLRLHQLFIDFSKCIPITTVFDEHKTMRAHTYPLARSFTHPQAYTRINMHTSRKIEREERRTDKHLQDALHAVSQKFQ